MAAAAGGGARNVRRRHGRSGGPAAGGAGGATSSGTGGIVPGRPKRSGGSAHAPVLQPILRLKPALRPNTAILKPAPILKTPILKTPILKTPILKTGLKCNAGTLMAANRSCLRIL
jgi:hypothetical protein